MNIIIALQVKDDENDFALLFPKLKNKFGSSYYTSLTISLQEIRIKLNHPEQMLNIKLLASCLFSDKDKDLHHELRH